MFHILEESLPSPLEQSYDHPSISASFHIQLDSSWGQGRTLFGGYLGVLLHRMIRKVDPDLPSLSSLVMDFIAPVFAQEVKVEVSLLRKGKSLIRFQAHLYQNQELKCIALAVFGHPRPSSLPYYFQHPPSFTPPQTGLSLSQLMNPKPQFTQYFEYRWVPPHLPFRSSSFPGNTGWIRPHPTHFDPTWVDEIELLILLFDAWPSPVMAMGETVFQASSVNWLLNLPPLLPSSIHKHNKPSPWYQYQAQAGYVKGGMNDVEASLWYEDQRLLGNSKQLAVYFDL